MRLFYVSDLHINPYTKDKQKNFTHFLKNVPNAQDVLVLGGDIFDLFVGNKTVFKIQYADVLAELARLSQAGTVIHYLEGNHDFHMQNVWGRETKLILHGGPIRISLGAKSVYIAHGDQIDPEDTGYHFLRWITRTWAVKALVALIPGAWLFAIGNWSSKKSRHYNDADKMSQESTLRIRNLFLDFAKKQARMGADFILLGHSHHKDEIKFNVGSENTAVYVNLGFESAKVPYFRLDESGEYKIESVG